MSIIILSGLDTWGLVHDTNLIISAPSVIYVREATQMHQVRCRYKLPIDTLNIQPHFISKLECNWYGRKINLLQTKIEWFDRS